MRTIGFVFLTATVATASLLAQQPEAKKDAIEKPERGKFVVDSPKQKPRVLDTHVHFFDPLRPTAPPRPKDGKPLPRPILPVDLKKLSDPHGVVGCIIVEASSVLEDNQWWLDLAAKGCDRLVPRICSEIEPSRPLRTS